MHWIEYSVGASNPPEICLSVRPNSKALPQFRLTHVDLRSGTSIRPVAAMDQMLRVLQGLQAVHPFNALPDACFRGRCFVKSRRWSSRPRMVNARELLFTVRR